MNTSCCFTVKTADKSYWFFGVVSCSFFFLLFFNSAQSGSSGFDTCGWSVCHKYVDIKKNNLSTADRTHMWEEVNTRVVSERQNLAFYFLDVSPNKKWRFFTDVPLAQCCLCGVGSKKTSRWKIPEKLVINRRATDSSKNSCHCKQLMSQYLQIHRRKRLTSHCWSVKYCDT